ncbi:MAG TPA: hypothetical protein ENK54_06685 [Thiotrichales bacterium]|nr:hypothetical protein [Thiotrichales bacterium]
MNDTPDDNSSDGSNSSADQPDDDLEAIPVLEEVVLPGAMPPVTPDSTPPAEEHLLDAEQLERLVEQIRLRLQATLTSDLSQELEITVSHYFENQRERMERLIREALQQQLGAILTPRKDDK